MGAKKENKLAAPIPVRGSAAIAELDPVEYTCMDIAKSNDRADHLCLGLEAGKTYTYTVSDATGEHPNLTIINRGSLAIVAVELGQGPSSQNLLASPIPPGGQATISTIPSGGGLQLVLMSRSNGMATAWAMTLAPGETCTYVMRDEKKKQKKKKKN